MSVLARNPVPCRRRFRLNLSEDETENGGDDFDGENDRKGEARASQRGPELALGTNCQYLVALNFNFHAKGRTHIAALRDATANPNIAGQIRGFQRIIQRPAARVADQRMRYGAIVIILP